MKYGKFILLVLTLSSCIPASAQYPNRHKVIALILSEHQLKYQENNTFHGEILSAGSQSAASVMLLPAQSTIPKYCLPKGNVFCRLEDYVQMHTPMKLNIGLAGQ